MALKKDYELDNGIVCNYHTPIIMQNNKKQTQVAISSFLNKEAYLAGKEPLRSRVDAVEIDSKYPTVKEIYKKIKESKLEKVVIQEAVEDVEEVFEMVEMNWYADAEDDV
jgi:hypothetical protein